MSKTLGVSKSGYHKWLDSNPKKEKIIYKIKETIKAEFKKSLGTYGSPRITQELNKKEIYISKSSTARMMKALKIQARKKKKYVITTDSNHKYNVPENLLDRKFKVDQINKIWVEDYDKKEYLPGFFEIKDLLKQEELFFAELSFDLADYR